MRITLTILFILACVGVSFGQKSRKKKPITSFPLVIECIDAYDMLPEEGVLLYIDDRLVAQSDSMGMLNVRLKRTSSSVAISLVDKDSMRVPILMKEYLSELVNNYHVFLYPNNVYEAEIWAHEDAVYGAIAKEEMMSDSLNFPVIRDSDTVARFVGGNSALSEYLSANIRTEVLPETNKTHVRFVVEMDGSLSHIVVCNNTDLGVERELIRVFRNMPKWIPGRIAGESVRARVQVPVTIKFER